MSCSEEPFAQSILSSATSTLVPAVGLAFSLPVPSKLIAPSLMTAPVGATNWTSHQPSVLGVLGGWPASSAGAAGGAFAPATRPKPASGVPVLLASVIVVAGEMLRALMISLPFELISENTSGLA